MSDARRAALARTIIRHSTRLEPGEAVLIDAYDLHDGLVHDLVDEAYRAGGIPIVQLRRSAILRRHLIAGREAQIALNAEIEMFQMRRMQAYIGLRAWENVSSLADVPPEHVALNARLYQKPVHSDYRVNHTKWVVLRYPTASMAQLANMSTEAFETFYFDVCSVDYARMSEAIVPLAERMRRTDRVRLVGPGTDLRFSIAGIGAVPCEGRHNLPDGECFTAPVRDSIEGTISYNAPSLYQGTTFTNIRLTFEGGRIVRAEGEPADRLRHLLSLDEGASRVGEFSLAFNPYVLHPIKDTLFDEKIAGSLHVTPGQAYERADNGNRSQIHWDLVLIQRPEYGGGEVWFDGECIRRDGRFLAPELEGLNPERLLGERPGAVRSFAGA
jgi:aminopeptidase